MKNIKFIITPIIACLLFFASCENDSQNIENQSNDKIEEKRITEEGFDFSIIEKTSLEELNKIEEKFIEVSKEISLIEELKKYEGEEEAPDLSIINDYLKYKGASPIDTEGFYYETEEIIRNPKAEATDLAKVLSNTNIYSDLQLKLFIELDAKMSSATTLDEAIYTLDNFKEYVLEHPELPSFEKTTLMLYASSMKGLMYTDANLQKGLGSCLRCVWKNKWRILGWGVFRSLPRVIGCVFSNLSNWGGMFWCIIRALGSGVAYTFKHYCGSVC